MERRFVLFLVLSVSIIIGHATLMNRLFPPPPKEVVEAPEEEEAPAEGDRKTEESEDAEKTDKTKKGEITGKIEKTGKPDKGEGENGLGEVGKIEGADKAEEAEKPDETAHPSWGTLGSADEKDPYRMLLTWTCKGGAIVRAELNSDRYLDLEDRSGYLGHLVLDESVVPQELVGKGCPVQVVGHGTPAKEAGLLPGDLIRKVDDREVTGPWSLEEALNETRPGRTVELTVQWEGNGEEEGVRPGKHQVKKGEQFTCTALLRRRPLEVIRPENGDPLSFLLTLSQIDGEKLSDFQEEGEEGERPGYLDAEIPGVEMRAGYWDVVEKDQTHVTFRRRLSKWGLEVRKTFSLEPIPEESIEEKDFKAYHLVLDVKIVYDKGVLPAEERDQAPESREVAYQLDGPTGLPTEGWWYARKFRDMVIARQSDDKDAFDVFDHSEIRADDFGGPRLDQVVKFIGVDAQYFASVLIPQQEGEKFAAWQPMRVGKVKEGREERTNTSCRLVSEPHEIKPGKGNAWERRFEVFVGPKRLPLLEKYASLDQLVDYGWFWFLARPMSEILHVFYAIVHNYGLAILMLTVLVRGCMFPLSKKQALGAQKMQELQPEIKKIQEKYKKNVEARTKAQQELFRKHNYNPLSGCLVLFVQLPIFFALYKSLWIDIELRQAPLLTERIRWCSNLAAPDMLFDWSGFVPGLVSNWSPYFNLLPILTIVLFILQQKMFMPPPADEQQAMQQKIMKFMMIFMGFLFFKVASGLCVYFIASSLWGLAERKFLPKTTPPKPADRPQTRAEAKAQTKPQPKPQPVPQRMGSNRDGAPGGKKKKGKKSRGRR